MSELDQRVFNWRAIGRALAIIVLIPAAYAFAVPPILGTALNYLDTGPIAGNIIYRLVFWGIAFALILWQGSWMRQVVQAQILDDMALTGTVATFILIGVKFAVWFIYKPVINCTIPVAQVTVDNFMTACTRINFLDMTDVIAAVAAIVLSFIGALANRFGGSESG